MFQAGYNNLPVATQNGTLYAIKLATSEGITQVEEFIKLFQKGLLYGFSKMKKPKPKRAERIIAKTAKAL